MTATGCAVAFGAAVYLLAAVGAAVLCGKSIRLADEHEPDDLCDLVVAESWSQAAINNAFDYMLPDLVTAEVFELDALLNRRATGGAA